MLSNLPQFSLQRELGKFYNHDAYLLAQLISLFLHYLVFHQRYCNQQTMEVSEQKPAIQTSSTVEPIIVATAINA